MRGKFHIAEWEIQPESNCLRRGEQDFHLEPKVMQVLLQLATHPNQVLSKEELIRTVWNGTFVGDDVLTRSISEIRRVLKDDAHSPKFIQTIPKSGYRLIVPVSYEPEVVSEVTVHPVAPAASALPSALAKPEPVRVRYTLLAITGMLVLLGAAFLFALRARRTPPPVASYKTVPFTSNLGAESQPSFSPDGKQIAYIWDGGEGRYRNLYVKIIGTESQLRLTSGDAKDYSPAWSPDGKAIAFLRQTSSDRGIYIVPSLGGPVRKVYTPSGKIDVAVEWERGALSWSPDGKRLIFSDGKSANTRSAIYALDLISLDVTQVTSPSNLVDGDYSPAFSPDGSHIAFVRGSEGFVRDIYVMKADGGNPTRLTFDNRFVSSLTWSSDSSAVIFSSDRGGKFGLWRISVNGGAPERLPVGGDDAFAPAISRAGNFIAYVQRSAKWSILRIPLQGAETSPTRLLSSTEQDSAPQYSPDGSRIAFQSWRSGTQEIWIASSDGTDLVKLTSFEGPLTGSPSWSPDGARIAFDSRPQGHSHIYSMAVNRGSPQALTEGSFNDILPTWSHDGHWIFFGSNRSGGWEIWKVPFAGGTPQQVTTQGGFIARDSADGKWIYYTKSDAPGIWRIAATGGVESSVINQPPLGFWGYWTLSNDNLYYLDSSSSKPELRAYDPASRRPSRVYALDHLPPSFAGLTVSPDKKWLLFTDLSDSGSHITLATNFR